MNQTGNYMSNVRNIIKFVIDDIYIHKNETAVFVVGTDVDIMGTNVSRRA